MTTEVPIELREAVGRRQVVCPLCEGHLKIVARGNADVVIPCQCAVLHEFWDRFTASVPVHDQFVHLNTLAPLPQSRLPEARQRDVINYLKANPIKSYAFYGAAGTSKSTYSVALYRHALTRMLSAKKISSPLSVWRVSVKTLLDDFVRESMGEEESGMRVRPVVNRRKIVAARQAGLQPCLFLEEVDKVKFTEFKTNALFELYDAIYENNGQLVFNTNLRQDDFTTQFGPEAGAAFARRIGEMCVVCDFYDQTK